MTLALPAYQKPTFDWFDLLLFDFYLILNVNNKESTGARLLRRREVLCSDHSVARESARRDWN